MIVKKPVFLGRELAQATSISIELVVPTVLGALVGYKIDSYLKSFPWFLVLGVILGGVSGFWTVYKLFVWEKK